MSLFGSFMSDFDDDPIFGHHMRSMRQMNTMMNSMFADPFGMFSPFDAIQGPSALTGGMPGHHQQQVQHHRNALMPFGFASMPNINRLLNAPMADGGTSFSSSQVISMSHGPDGRPQIYKATSSTKTGPGGLRETQKTVQDSRSGMKKMAIGHHIGERSHVIEREHNLRTGEEAERQDFVNIEEDEADDFNREFTTRTRQMLPNGRRSNSDLPAIMPSTTSTTSPVTSMVVSVPSVSNVPSITNRRNSRHSPLASVRRPLRTPSSSPLALPSSTTYTPPTTSIHPHPYNAASRRANRQLKAKHHSEHHHRNSPSESK